MSGTTEEFSRVKTCALLKDGGWNLTDGMSVRFDHLSRWLAGARRLSITHIVDLQGGTEGDVA